MIQIKRNDREDDEWGTLQTISFGDREARLIKAHRAMQLWQQTWHAALDHAWRIVERV